MMRKMIYQLISVCFLFGALASCSSEDEPGKASQSTGISLDLKTTGQTRSSVEPGTEAERQINSISVWFFEDGSNDTDKAMFYSNIASSSSTGNITLNFTDEELRLHNMTSEGKYEIFVAANLPVDATIDGETTLADLKGYSYTATTRPGSPFCMTGGSVGVHNFGANSQISIPLLRVASRLDITVKNATGKSWSIDKISIAGDQKSVLLFAPASGTTAPTSNAFGDVQTVMTTSATNDEVVCSGYIYENRSANAVKVVVEGNVDGTAKTWTAELMPDGSTTLPRNTICGVTLNLKESAPVVPTDVESIVKDWDTETLNTSLFGTYLDINKSNVDVLYLQGGVLNINSDAEKIHVDWKNASGFYLLNHEADTEATINLTEQTTTLEFHFNGESDVIIPDGIITITAGNLHKDVTLKKMNSNAIFKINQPVINGHSIPEGGKVPSDFWGSTNVEDLIYPTAYTNLTWAYKLIGYSEKANAEIIECKGISVYNGTTGNAGITNGEKGIMPNFKIQGIEELLPVEVTMTFYLNSHVSPWNGITLGTFHFTIDK